MGKRKVFVDPDTVALVLVKGEEPSNQGLRREVNGIPHDAVLVESGYDSKFNQFFLVFEHESFGLTPKGPQTATWSRCAMTC